MYFGNFINDLRSLSMFRYLTALAGLALVLSCREPREQVKPRVERITQSVYASGIEKSRNQYQVFSTVSGLVQEILVREGDFVRKGDAIMKLASVATRLNMEQARLAAQNASIAANRDRLRELEFNMEVARAKMEYDRSILLRQQSLWADSIGTRNNLDALELTAKTSESSYKAAVAQYKDLERQIQFQALQSQKSLQLSESTAEDYLIKSNADGKVYSLLRKRGELVSPQSPVALIGDASGFMLELQVDEFDIAKVAVGQKILLHMDSYKGQTFEAEVERINPAMNSESRSFTVEAGFTKAPPVLYPNLTCEANIVTQVKDGALTIPRSYLIDDSLVMLESGKLRKVSTGLKDYQKVEILDGLSVNDVILQSVNGK